MKTQQQDGVLDNVSIPIFTITIAFIGLFCGWALVDLTSLSAVIDKSFALSVEFFGLYWQVLLLATFLISVVLCFFPGSKAKMGALAKPEFTLFQWSSMVMCTLLAGGGVFWAAGEPMAHYMSTPPLFSEYSGVLSDEPNAKVWYALAQSYLHWGFLAWAILGSLTAPMLMYYHYEKGLPLAPRTLLYPVLKEKALTGPIAWITDSACIIAVMAGTVGPIGFLGLQVAYGLDELFGLGNTFLTQAIVILVLMCVYIISSLSGLTKGIKYLSQLNIILGVALLVFMLIFGATLFIFEGFFKGETIMLTQFFNMTLFRADEGWLGWWTVFFWGWFLGYGPLMAIFIAKVSRGRSIRSIIILMSIIAPLVTNLWFTIIGGNGISLDMANDGIVAKAMEGFNLPAALLAITQNLPLGFIISVLFLLLTTIFVATTSDSMTYTIAISSSKDKETPSPLVRLFWGVAMGIVALILLKVGDGSIGKLQNFIVVTAVPVSIILLPSLWDCARIVLLKGKQLNQG